MNRLKLRGKGTISPRNASNIPPEYWCVCFSSVRAFIKIIEVKEEEEWSIMDPRAYATLFPRERFETFASAAIPLRPPPADVHDEEQQQATASQSRPIGRARQFVFGFAGLATAAADEEEEGGGASVLVHLMPPTRKRSKSASSSSFRKTTVLCASSLQSAFKNPRKPTEGFVEVRVDIASCSRAENTKNNADVVERAATIARVIRETVFPSRGQGGKGRGGLIDRSVLKGDGLEGDKCWKFIVECLVLDDDMGTMDACLAAVVACARKTRAPSILAGGDNAKGKGKKRQMLAVNRNFKPVCLTVGAFNLSTTENTDLGEKKKYIGDGSKKRKMNEEEEEDEKVGDEDEIEDYEPPKQIVIVDPTYEETKLCDALIHVIVDENGNVLGLEKSHHGASEVDETVLAKAIAAAKLRHGEVWKRIEQFDEMEEEEEDDDEEEDE